MRPGWARLLLAAGLAAGHGYTFSGLSLNLDKFPGDDTNRTPISVFVEPESMTCVASLGGKAIAGSGTGGCHWQIPANSAGKQLLVAVHVSVAGADATFKIPLTISS